MRRITFAASIVLFLTGFGTVLGQSSFAEIPSQGPKSPAEGEQVMVSTQLPIVTEAALKVLREGGNAVDAMVTAVFLQHVNDYHQVSHFGAMSALYYDAAENRFYALNAVSERPLAGPDKEGDPSKVAIGGVVRGLEALHKRYGTRPWADLVVPAIESAEEGVLVTSFMYGVNYALMERGDWLQNEEARQFYLPEGHLVPVGQRWKMPRFAETLRKVASEGADYLYEGAWAKKFVEAATKKGYGVTLEDMAVYEPKWDDPTRFTYRGHELLGSPPPDTGGLVVGFNLNVLENFDLASLGHYSTSADAAEVMVRAFGRVRDETRWAINDPLTFQVPSQLWLDKEYGRSAARFVRESGVLEGVDLAPSAEEVARLDAQDASPLFPVSPSGDHAALGSNHNVIVDAQGNWISMLHTGHGGAPGIFIDGVRAGGSSARASTKGPGRRLVLPITAIMIVKDGKPWLALGTPGSPPQPVTEVLVNILDFGMPPLEAADAPRFWAFRNNDRQLEIESRISDEVRTELPRRGIKIKDLGAYNWHTGSMQIVWRDAETGRLHGVTDPRRLGFTKGY